MNANRVARRAALTALSMSALGLPVLLTACGGGRPGPVRYAPLGWDYLSPLKLNVAAIDVVDSWTTRAGSREKGFLAPTPPVEALRKMAADRLIPAGTSGRAVFVIEDASIVQSGDTYRGSFAVHLDVTTSDGTRSGYAEARALRTRSIRDDSPDGVRAELYDMVKQMMSDMNVEFEYQVHRSLRDYLQTTAPAAPEPGPVERQDLAAPAEVPPPSAAPPLPSAVPFSSPAPTPLVR
jgi:hypothetical protein